MTSSDRTLEIVLDKERIRLSEGYCFNIAVENIEAFDEILLFENDRRLGPIENMHSRIRDEGRGLFSPWDGHLFFSSSDGSDPGANSRTYSLKARIFSPEEKRRQKPKTLHLNLTEKCNLRCRICKPEEFTSYAGSASLSREVIDKVIADAFDSLSQLRLDSAGELLLSPHLPYVLQEATKRSIPIFVSTNGLLITEEKAEMLCSSSLDSIQISCDSPDRETLEWIRRGADFDKLIRGTENLVRTRERHGGKRPRIEFHAALLQQNLHQLPDLVRMAKKLGIEGVGVAYGFIHSFMDPEWAVIWEKERCNGIVREAFELSKELGISFNAPILFNAPRDISTTRYCQYLFEWSYIQPTGKVYPCCIGAGDYECGDLNSESFTDVWFGERYEKLRSTYDTPNPAFYKCASCYISAGWHPNDYKSHFSPNHWKYVEERLKGMPREQECSYCTYGEYLFPADLADDIQEMARHLNNGEAQAAAAILAKAINRHPDLADLYNLYAETLVHDDRLAEAHRVLHGILEEWPDNWQALNNLSVLATNERRYADALELLKKVLARNPANTYARNNLSRLKEMIVMEERESRQQKKFTHAN
ncbi:MAG: radical SAM protein [Geobacteraceae bacterium]|jgi:radical SAM protein with 4Fe4S-binding SPASM domain